MKLKLNFMFFTIIPCYSILLAYSNRTRVRNNTLRLKSSDIFQDLFPYVCVSLLQIAHLHIDVADRLMRGLTFQTLSIPHLPHILSIPHITQGILVPRGREQLDRDMQDCFLMTRDGSTLACGMLKKYRCVSINLVDYFLIVNF